MERRELMFAPADDPGQVFAALSTRYAVHAEAARMLRWTCLDTADWRLNRAGMTLRDARHGRSAELVLTTCSAERIAAPTRMRSWPRRVDALPPSPVRDRIAPAVGVRALLPLADVDVRSIPLSLLDEADKTRVRVRVDQQRLTGAGNTALPLRVLITSLRGYERDAHRCADLLGAAMEELDPHAPAATIAMTAAGFAPGQPAVPPLRLDAGAPAVQSLAEVLRRWMDVIDTARPGVLDDLDPEYLHELRAAVRATRSMLSMSGDLLPGAQAARFATEFAWLGRLSAPVRDLDVYLLELAGRGALDLARLDDDLEPLTRQLAGRRAHALQNLRAGLRSPRGRALTADGRRTLDALAAPEVPGPTTNEMAAAQLRSAYRRIVKAANAVTAHPPADELHQLRRHCKRMRYLLDGYESVYPAQPHRQVLATLKKLQDCLGDIQDSDVQRRQLAESTVALIRRGTPVGTVLALGALRERTSLRDAAARQDLTRWLRRVCGPVTRAHVDALASAPSS